MNESNFFYIKLKEQRESSGISLEDISDFTKIDIKYLIAIEEGDFSCLPNVYMRLFLRSYCEYIKVDEVKALNDYEFYTIGTISSDKTSSNNSKDNEVGIDIPIDENSLNLPPVSKSQIITILATVIMLALAFYLISSITDSSNNSIIEEDPVTQEDSNSSSLDILNSKLDFSPIPNQDLLTNKEFESNLISSESVSLNTEFPPYIFTIKPLAQTKINIDNDGQIMNRIIAPGEDISLIVNSVIKFDLWSASHIDCKLNDIDLNTLFGRKEESIRGSFEAKDQRLYYQVHSQLQK